MNGNTNGQAVTKTQETINEFKKGLNNDIKNAKSQAEVSCTNRVAKVDADNANQGLYCLVEDGYVKYLDLKTSSTTSLDQDAVELYSDICDLQDTVKKSVDEKFEAALTNIKDLKTKIKGVSEAYCKVENEINDNCNSKQRQILQNSVKHDENSSKCQFVVGTGEIAFEKWIQKLCEDVKALQGKSGELSDMTVKIASWMAQVNFENLKLVGATLKDSTKKLKDDVTANIGFLEKELKAACDELVKSEMEQRQAAFQERTSNLTLQSLYKTCEFTNDNLELPTGQDFQQLEDDINSILSCKTLEPQENPETGETSTSSSESKAMKKKPKKKDTY